MYAPAQALAMALDRRMRARSLDQEAASQDQALAGHLLSQGQQAQQGQMASEDMLERLKQQAAASAQRAQLRASGDITEERIRAETLSNKIAEQERTKRGLGIGRLQGDAEERDENKRKNLAREEILRGANQARMAEATRPRGGNKMRPEEFRQLQSAKDTAAKAWDAAKKDKKELENNVQLSAVLGREQYEARLKEADEKIRLTYEDLKTKQAEWKRASAGR